VLNGQRRKETIVPLQVTAIMIGVEDLARSKKFYGEGLGCTIDQDHPISCHSTWAMDRRRWLSTNAAPLVPPSAARRLA
jgi:hypothetical protein